MINKPIYGHGDTTMATKHLFAAVKNGEFKFAAFGRWDGSPKGFGSALISGLTPELLESLRDKLDLVITSEVFDGAKVPLLEHDLYPNTVYDFQACSIMHQVVNLLEPTVIQGTLISAASSFCEWIYVIDFDQNKFEVYSQYCLNLDVPSRFDFLAEKVEGAEKVGLMRSYDFAELPLEVMDIVNPYDPAA